MVPPVPIPNTEVKHSNAEGTWVATPREIRYLPLKENSALGLEDSRLNLKMATLVKWLTRRIVAPICVGSIPMSRPNRGIAQLVERRSPKP